MASCRNSQEWRYESYNVKANCITFQSSCLNTYAFKIYAFFLFFSHSSDALSVHDAMS